MLAAATIAALSTCVVQGLRRNLELREFVSSGNACLDADNVAVRDVADLGVVLGDLGGRGAVAVDDEEQVVGGLRKGWRGYEGEGREENGDSMGHTGEIRIR